MKKLFKISVFFVIVLFSCTDYEPLNYPPELKSTKLIFDGANDGNQKFYFLPPLVPETDYEGIFDGFQSPNVKIYEVVNNIRSEDFILELDVNLQLDEEQYHSIWDTKEVTLNTESIYRIEVSIENTLIGFADVVIASTGSELKKIDTNEYIALKDGRSLPIKFRIEEDVLDYNDNDEDGFISLIDCDDSNPEVNPESDEICDNNIDENCDGEIDEDCITLPEPIAYYPFNGNANDESGFSNDGNVSGAQLTTDRFGKVNSAYSFDGVDDFIQVPSTQQNKLGSNDFTISVWFRSTSSDEGVIFNKRNTSNCSQASGPTVGISQTSSSNGNYFVARVRKDRNDGDYRLNTTIQINDGIWHLGIITRENDILKLYFDGFEVSTLSIEPNIDFSTTLDLFIGKTIYCGGNHFKGDIDDFTIYSSALSKEEIDYILREVQS